VRQRRRDRRLAVFLCIGAASHINGAAITVDGGQGGHV
jgi:NAD(P)-dependent dehydrogenase (short-subunit alcohol dehydrogenase family)